MLVLPDGSVSFTKREHEQLIGISAVIANMDAVAIVASINDPNPTLAELQSHGSNLLAILEGDSDAQV
jgi:hypothetical protein